MNCKSSYWYSPGVDSSLDESLQCAEPSLPANSIIPGILNNLKSPKNLLNKCSLYKGKKRISVFTSDVIVHTEPHTEPTV